MRQLFIISLFSLLLNAGEAWAEVVIIVRQQAEATGNYIRVCDIARVEGPKELAAEVAKTVLGPTPVIGEVREITRWEIEHRIYEVGLKTAIAFTGNDSVRVLGTALRARNFDYADIDGVAVEQPARGASAPAPVTIMELPESRPVSAVNDGRERAAHSEAPGNTTPAQPRNPLTLLADDTRDQVSRVISNYLAERYKRPDVEVEVRLVSISGVIPGDAGEIVVEEALEGRIPGRASLALRYMDASGQTTKNITAAIDAEVFALAPVAAKPLYKGDVLAPRDVLITRIKMKSGQSYLPPDPRAVEGREMQKPVSPGAPILATDATPSAAVKRGNVVAVDASGTGWRLQANAKALGSGNIGDVIEVEDVSTKAKYQARVIGYGKVAAVARKVNHWRD